MQNIYITQGAFVTIGSVSVYIDITDEYHS